MLGIGSDSATSTFAPSQSKFTSMTHLFLGADYGSLLLGSRHRMALKKEASCLGPLYKHLHFKITGQHILDGDDRRYLPGITKQPPLACNILMDTISQP
jgi:hypothetical protein